jgi:hypothetical protein
MLVASALAMACYRGSASAPVSHLRVSPSGFVTADDHPFQWRGITAFRLLEYVAQGKESDVERYLSWAHEQRLTVVRVLAMGQGFMNLSPADGVRALPRLLEIAAKHDLHVEVVALAGTRDAPVDLDQHLAAVGRIAEGFDNAIVEIANEPVHPSQSADVQRPDVLTRLRSRVPASVPVALGSIETGEGFAAGDYVTWHVPRENRLEGWGHVLAIADGAGFLRRWNKPVISDEPIGAGPRYEAGRRDDSSARFRAAALLTRLVGLGATFHYEGGLQATIPTGRELECFRAWNEAWTRLPADVERSGTFLRVGEERSAVAEYRTDKAAGVYERQRGNMVWVVIVNPRPDFSLRWRTGWVPGDTRRLDGVWLLNGRRDARRPFGR